MKTLVETLTGTTPHIYNKNQITRLNDANKRKYFSDIYYFEIKHDETLIKIPKSFRYSKFYDEVFFTAFEKYLDHFSGSDTIDYNDLKVLKINSRYYLYSEKLHMIFESPVDSGYPDTGAYGRWVEAPVYI